MKGDVNSTRPYYIPGSHPAKKLGCTCFNGLTILGKPKIDPRCPLHGHLTDTELTLGEQSIEIIRQPNGYLTQKARGVDVVGGDLP